MTAAITLRESPLARPSTPYRELVSLDDASLESIFKDAAGPAPEALAGFEWRGFNTPFWTRLLGVQKFIKGFATTGGTSQTPSVEGYNVRVSQGGLDTPWAQKPSASNPRLFGFFTVEPVDTTSRDNRYPRATLLDYGASRRNRWYLPDDLTMKVLRDYVVQPDPQNPDLMLGKAYIALGPFRLYSNFFVIERLRPIVKALGPGR
jgi:hypothetical protein